DYDLTNSRLEYWGDPTVGKREGAGIATAIRMPPEGERKDTTKPRLSFGHDPAAFQEHLREHHERMRELHARMGLPDVFHGFGGGAPARTEVAAPPTRVSVGDPVPDFTFTGLDGKTVKLRELRLDPARPGKKVVVLSFWCSFCPSCRRVEQALDRLAKNYA